MQHFVTYTRVSTKEQGKSGLGLDAQKRDIALFLSTYAEVPFEVVKEFTDILSGANSDRPELTKALALCRKTGATLLVSKLDRLSRRASFITALMEDKKVAFRVAAMPTADTFQLHIYAALAEQERTFISLRTKAALAAWKVKARAVAKAAGKADGEEEKLGGLRDKTGRRNDALKAGADERARKVSAVVKPLRDAGKTLREIAGALNASGVATARGGSWSAAQVMRTLDRLGKP